jgi:hypothetical protein
MLENNVHKLIPYMISIAIILVNLILVLVGIILPYEAPG